MQRSDEEKDVPRSTGPSGNPDDGVVSDFRTDAFSPETLLGRLPGPLLIPPFLLVLGITAALGAVAWTGQKEEAPPIPVEEVALDLVDAELPVQVNHRVERWIRRFLTTGRADFEHYLAREGLYGGMIRDRLRSRDMPEGLLYLAMIESGFSPWATSPVLASGVWQFMGPTARAYGLRVDQWVDERRDPLRATDAALDYLDELYQEFGSWHLAAAAYNAGPGRVAQALSRVRQGTVDEDELYWEIIEHLPRETREYVPKIIAAAILAEQAEHFGFEVGPDLPYLFEQVLVPGGTSLRRVAEAAEVPTGLMRDLNPHLIRGVTPPDGSFMVRVPQGASGQVVAAHAYRAGAGSRVQ